MSRTHYHYQRLVLHLDTLTHICFPLSKNTLQNLDTPCKCCFHPRCVGYADISKHTQNLSRIFLRLLLYTVGTCHPSSTVLFGLDQYTSYSTYPCSEQEYFEGKPQHKILQLGHKKDYLHMLCMCNQIILAPILDKNNNIYLYTDS